MWGLGAALGPQVANFGLAQQNIDLAFLFTGVFSLLLIIPFSLTSLEPRRSAPQSQQAGFSSINLLPLLPFALLIFVYIGAENGFGSWIFTELTKITGSSESIGALATSLFWGGLTMGRIFATVLLRRFSDENLLLLMTLLIALGAGTLLVIRGVESLALMSAFLVGIGSGPIFPTTLAILNRRFPHGAVAGVVVAFGTTGGIVGPWLQGQVGDGVSGGMIVTVILGFVLFGLTMLLQRKPVSPAQVPQLS
jgi:fucose permease